MFNSIRLVFMIDASNRERLLEARDELLNYVCVVLKIESVLVMDFNGLLSNMFFFIVPV
jgi:hypothetical protein